MHGKDNVLSRDGALGEGLRGDPNLTIESTTQ